jgi:monoamine oxidase
MNKMGGSHLFIISRLLSIMRRKSMSSYIYPELSTEQMLSIIKNGLPKTQNPKKIIIIGAGMAGLVSASLLKQAGHHVTILEASERVGGRIYTLRGDFRDGQYL